MLNLIRCPQADFEKHRNNTLNIHTTHFDKEIKPAKILQTQWVPIHTEKTRRFLSFQWGLMCYEPLLKTVCLWRAPPFGQNSDLPGCTWSGAVGAGLNHFRTSSMRQTGSYGSDPTDTVCTAASWGAEREAGQRGRRQQRKETSGLVWERHLSAAAVSDPDQTPRSEPTISSALPDWHLSSLSRRASVQPIHLFLI